MSEGLLPEIAAQADAATAKIRLTTEEMDKITAAARTVGEIGHVAFHGIVSGLESMERFGGAAGEVLGSLAGSLRSISRGDVVGLAMSLRDAARGLSEMSTEADRSENAIRLLGPAYEEMSRATNDTIDETDAFRLQQRLLETGLHATGEELASVAGYAREHARTLGISATEATERLTGALITGSARGLRPFGLAVDHNATRSANWHSVLGQMNDRMAETGVTARTASEDLARSERELGDATNRLGRSLAELIHLRGALDGLTHFITGAGYDERGEAAAAAQHARELTDDTRKFGDAVATAHSRFHELNGEMPQFSALSREAARNFTSDLAHAHSVQEARATIANAVELQHITARTAALHAQNDAAAAAQLARAHDRDANDMGGAPAGAGAHPHEEDAERIRTTIVELNSLRAQMAALGVEMAHVERDAGETSLHYLERVQHMRHEAIAAQTVINEAATARLHAEDAYTAQANAWADERIATIRREEDAQIEALHTIDAARKVHDVAARDSADIGVQMSAQWRQALQVDQTQAQSVTAATIEAWGAVTGAFKQHLAAYISGKETMQQALAGMLSDVLLNIATSSAVKALESQAAAIFAAAAEDYPGAAKFEAAAIAYTGVAVATGFGASAMMQSSSLGASSGGSQAVPPRNASSARSETSDQGGGGNTTIIVSGAMFNEGVEEAVRRAAMSLRQRGRWIDD